MDSPRTEKEEGDALLNSVFRGCVAGAQRLPKGVLRGARRPRGGASHPAGTRPSPRASPLLRPSGSAASPAFRGKPHRAGSATFHPASSDQRPAGASSRRPPPAEASNSLQVSTPARPRTASRRLQPAEASLHLRAAVQRSPSRAASPRGDRLSSPRGDRVAQPEPARFRVVGDTAAHPPASRLPRCSRAAPRPPASRQSCRNPGAAPVSPRQAESRGRSVPSSFDQTPPPQAAARTSPNLLAQRPEGPRAVQPARMQDRLSLQGFAPDGFRRDPKVPARLSRSWDVLLSFNGPVPARFGLRWSACDLSTATRR